MYTQRSFIGKAIILENVTHQTYNAVIIFLNCAVHWQIGMH